MMLSRLFHGMISTKITSLKLEIYIHVKQSDFLYYFSYLICIKIKKVPLTFCSTVLILASHFPHFSQKFLLPEHQVLICFLTLLEFLFYDAEIVLKKRTFYYLILKRHIILKKYLVTHGILQMKN